MPDDKSVEYINSRSYTELEMKVKQLDDILDDLQTRSRAARKLRYSEIDINAEREAGRLQPDELYVPQHIIDTNIRREQSPYVQYITQSPRAVILEDEVDPTVDLSLLEKDLTKKLRFDGWQSSMFSTIDGFQANGYAIMELIYDLDNPGELEYESVQYGDFAFIMDTRDIQEVEMTSRAYYFTKTKLVNMRDKALANPDSGFNADQLQLVIDSDPTSSGNYNNTYEDSDDKSLYRLKKVMFRIGGVVNVGWVCSEVCNDWIRKPKPLFIGRRKLTTPTVADKLKATLLPAMGQPSPLPPSSEQYETQYPYFLFPYLISENDTISQLKGRVYLDQDVQEAVSSLLSSTVTKARRSAGMYFSKDVSDPNDDLLMQKNIFFRSGCLINSKVAAFNLEGPDPALFSAIQMLVTGNQNETSQVNFAVNNRKDSRKTAKEIEVASSQAQILSTVQVVLFSLALKKLYSTMSDIIKSRVQAGLITVNQQVRPLYDRTFIVKPSGDVDVIEKQQMIQTMMNAWPVIQNTPAAQPFLADLIELMFPLNAPKYMQAFMQAQQQAQSQQAQQSQQLIGMVQQLGAGIVKLSKHPEMFSETGRIHAFPIVKTSAEQLEQLEQQMKQGAQTKK